jgi:exonuclease III
LNVDVIAIQEAQSDTQALIRQHEGWTCLWREGRYYPGLAVLARSPFRLDEEESSGPSVLSCIVSGGPITFRFVNFWAMTPRNVGGVAYTAQARHMIEHLPDDGLPTVVAGDFNHSKHPPHLDNVDLLSDRGLVSAYHKIRGILPSDMESEMTRYAGGGPDKGSWHIDLVFVPKDWPITKVDIGAYEDYPGRNRSDHVPVVVTLPPDQPEVST